MPTAKHRINITLDTELCHSLERLSKKQKRSLSNVSLKLIERAIELEEDRYFSKKADERLAKHQKRISHQKAWE